ncbi:phospholipase, patatin family [Sulfurimonas gotlandica GD1]|uniref:Phospholipase, patatin family n=1 Tax=Sulfurimonas gotlandica (strain DSM 19862 / JCM 16533 / GD1) TaxID=929558 RepID=B6BK00_SULGG|nr:patatin-like phospholipase family protein [Sulfurimonas gotlandica]EDZ62757.1 outer membrane protein, OMP85 family, putative [Sulfurimonas gotlandica GD1]EHP31091.1 phospholipase, patatin family [Sulfurimonas gotlandica GD1]
MKILLILALIFGVVLGQDRPKIALVLSGGGARGGAHVGVLKVLEENKIPVDIIVGTSMGSFVGGLYASGRSADDIEQMLVSSDWKNYIRTDFDRADTPMRVKEVEYIYQGRLGLGIDSKNSIVLPTGVLKRQPLLLKFMAETQHAQNIIDFDDLAIPFRAVATNIANGDPVVLKSGSLAKAIYASSSIPGGLQPINIDGIDLVDGGVSDNLPVQLAKDMGADIIIAVDVSENFDEKIDVNSYFVVLGQMVNILMRKNANESILKLSDKDILLTPDLTDFSGLDADKYASIIQKGADVTRNAYDSKLKHLSISNADYEEYKKKYRVLKEFSAPIIDAIEIDNPTYISNESILRRIKIKVGDRLDENVLRANLMHIYNMTIFDSVEYTLKKVEGKNILVITTTPSWNNHGEMRFAIGVEDDFKGHSSYSLKAGYTMFGLNSYGGEWKNDIEIGRRQRAYTEIFQPLDTMQRYYLRPSLVYDNVIEFVPYGSGTVELETKRYGTSLGIGAHVTTDYEFEVGAGAFKDSLEVSIVSGSYAKYQARPIYASFLVDNLDNLNFPNTGLKSMLKWTKEMKELGSDYEHEKIYFDIEKPITFNSHNITTYLQFGTTYNNNNDKSTLNLNDKFILGGLFNMSAYKPYSIVGNHMALGVVKYRYQLKDGGFFGTLDAPLYTGFSLEIGDAWDDGIHRNINDLKKSVSVYVAADTFLGPFYLAYASSEDGENSFYLYLGEKF